MVMKLCLKVPPDSILVSLPWHGYVGHELIHRLPGLREAVKSPSEPH
jgi:hypothetical protein